MSLTWGRYILWISWLVLALSSSSHSSLISILMTEWRRVSDSVWIVVTVSEWSRVRCPGGLHITALHSHHQQQHQPHHQTPGRHLPPDDVRGVEQQWHWGLSTILQVLTRHPSPISNHFVQVLGQVCTGGDHVSPRLQFHTIFSQLDCTQLQNNKVQITLLCASLIIFQSSCSGTLLQDLW